MGEIKWEEGPPHVCGPSGFLPQEVWPQDASPRYCGAQGLGQDLMLGLGAGDLEQGQRMVAGGCCLGEVQGLDWGLGAGAQWPQGGRPFQRFAHSIQ